jgi:hypothetical protein
MYGNRLRPSKDGFQSAAREHQQTTASQALPNSRSTANALPSTIASKAVLPSCQSDGVSPLNADYGASDRNAPRTASSGLRR